MYSKETIKKNIDKAEKVFDSKTSLAYSNIALAMLEFNKQHGEKE